MPVPMKACLTIPRAARFPFTLIFDRKKSDLYAMIRNFYFYVSLPIRQIPSMTISKVGAEETKRGVSLHRRLVASGAFAPRPAVRVPAVCLPSLKLNEAQLHEAELRASINPEYMPCCHAMLCQSK
jgi:hypothetical protein